LIFFEPFRASFRSILAAANGLVGLPGSRCLDLARSSRPDAAKFAIKTVEAPFAAALFS
jgi:hypothetical protein